MAARKPQSRRKPEPKTPSELRLLGTVAVVTGASRGIGQAIACTLAAEACNVVITGRDKSALARSAKRIAKALPEAAVPKTKHPQIVAEVCDVRDPESVAELFAKVKQKFRKLDILVNNAGITQPVASVEETSLELWQNVIATNLTAIFLCTRAALPLMKSGATIVNNLSAAAVQVFPNFAAYSAAKRGALGFTLSLRQELIPRGIRVVALMPGATATDMWDQIMPNAPREKMMSVDSVAQTVLYAVLLPPNANLSEVVLAPTGGAL